MGQREVCFNAEPDHVHFLLGMTGSVALSNLLRGIKSFSTSVINKEHWVRGRFGWQTGFSGFSVSATDLEPVKRYIANQQSHHQVVSYREEVLSLLAEHGIEYDSRFLFNDTFLEDGRAQ
jgi:hypothetical protein